MNKPLLLDLYCKAGGAAKGYADAGFKVIGVDIEPQKNYPYEFIQSDAIAFLRDKHDLFDAFHASPPCQRYSTMTARHGQKRIDGHPDLIESTRLMLIVSGKPYVIENVPQAPLFDSAVTLCGSMFGLKVRRHRKFEANVPILDLPECNHVAQGRPVGVYGHAGGRSVRDGLTFGGTDTWREAMDIDWMTGDELAEAVPPAYTRFIGAQLIRALR